MPFSYVSPGTTSIGIEASPYTVSSSVSSYVWLCQPHFVLTPVALQLLLRAAGLLEWFCGPWLDVVELAWPLPEAAEPPCLPVEKADWLPAEAASPPRRLHHRD